MSEPSSFYLRVTLTPEALKAFRASPVSLPSAYDDWSEWLENSQFHGTIGPERIAKLETYMQSLGTVGTYVDQWLDSRYSQPVRDHYNPETQTWTLCILQCSENYVEFIEVLSIMRAACQFKDVQSGDDFILIFSYLWDGGINVYVPLDMNSSQLHTQVPEQPLEEAKAALADVLAQSIDPDRKY